MSVHLYEVLRPVKLAAGNVALTPVQAGERWYLPPSTAKLPAIEGRSWHEIPDGRPVWFPIGDSFAYDGELHTGESLAEHAIKASPDRKESHRGAHSAPKRRKRGGDAGHTG